MAGTGPRRGRHPRRLRPPLRSGHPHGGTKQIGGRVRVALPNTYQKSGKQAVQRLNDAWAGTFNAPRHWSATPLRSPGS